MNKLKTQSYDVPFEVHMKSFDIQEKSNLLCHYTVIYIVEWDITLCLTDTVTNRTVYGSSMHFGKRKIFSDESKFLNTKDLEYINLSEQDIKYLCNYFYTFFKKYGLGNGVLIDRRAFSMF